MRALSFGMGRLGPLAAASLLALAACNSPAPATPTTGPAPVPAPTVPALSAKPTTPPLATVPSPAIVASPAAAPAAAVSPVAATSPLPVPAATFDEQAVAGFYRGKNVRVVVGFGAGGLIDTYSRTIARYLGKYIPGNPNVVVENRGGAGSLTLANAIYKSEAKDGTVIGSFGLGLVLVQAVKGPNIEFDAPRYNWIGAANSDNVSCLVRSSKAQSLQELMGPNGKEIATGSLGAGTNTYQVPTVLNLTLGTHFKLVPGYSTLALARLAFDSGEIDAYCPSFGAALSLDRDRLEGANPPAKMVTLFGDYVPKSTLAKGVPKAVDLVQGDDQKLIRAVSLQDAFNPNYAMAPEVPRDRVLAIRRALAQALADPALLADAQKASQTIEWRSAEDLEQGVRDILGLPPAILDRIRPLVT